MTTGSAPGNIAVPLEIVSQGDENALGFTLTFNPQALGNPTVALGADAAGGQLSTNTRETAQRRLGIAPALLRRVAPERRRAANCLRAVGGAGRARRN